MDSSSPSHKTRSIVEVLQSHGAFASALDKCEDIRSDLQDQTRLWTIWVPETLPPGETLSRPMIEQLISPLSFPSYVLRDFGNVPTIYCPPDLNGVQRLRTRPIFDPEYGPTFSVNFAAKVVKPDIEASNGTIHILDRLPGTPEPLIDIIDALPAASFSVLQRAIKATGFDDELRNPSMCGSTFFAPTNAAFEADTAKRTEGLTAASHTEHLLTLLRRHLVPNVTFYNNRTYKATREECERGPRQDLRPPALPPSEIPFIKGDKVMGLGVDVDGRPVKVAVHRYGHLVDLTVNEGARVVSADHLASNGVLHVVDALVGEFRGDRTNSS